MVLVIRLGYLAILAGRLALIALNERNGDKKGFAQAYYASRLGNKLASDACVH